MAADSQPKVLIADEIGHLTAALKAPGESLGNFELQFCDSLQIAQREVRDTFPAVVVVVQRKLPNGTGLETAGDIWRSAPGLQIVVVSDTEVEVDAETWHREFGGTDRVVLLPWTGRGLEISQLLNTLVARHVAESTTDVESTQFFKAVKAGFAEEVEYERSLMQAIMNNSPDRIFFKDRESRYVRCSASLAEQFGVKSAKDVVDQSDFDYFSEEHALETFADDQEVIRTGEPMLAKKERETSPDGASRWVLTSRIPWLNPDGRIIGVCGISKDITELMETELEMEAYRERLQALLDHMPDRIYFKNTQSRFVMVSQAMVERLNVESPDQVEGKTDFDFHPPELARQFMQDEELIMASGNPLINKVEEQKDAHGETIWASVTKVPTYDAMGQVTGLIGISRDITDMKHTEATLQQTNEDLRRASRLAGMAEVATGVLHNIGNVLNSINVSSNVVADLIRRSKSANLERICGLLEANDANLGEFLTNDEKGRQIPDFLKKLATVLHQEQETLLNELEEMHMSIDHIRDIITTQQGYAKVGGTVEELEPEDLLEQAMKMEDNSLKGHDVTIERDMQPTPRIAVEKHKLIQVLVNLVRNTKQAMAATREKKLIVAIGTKGDDGVYIAVTDNGKGIEKENLEKIFSHGFTTKKDGHGFGLHSSALAVKEMGGRIYADSRGPGNGATFTVELPSRQPEKD
ncbi:MAG: PAS domain-containing protein [Limisphaerales bacterium]